MCSIWKILHLTEYFYTGTAHGARNNYQVWQELALNNRRDERFWSEKKHSAQFPLSKIWC